ncbi:molybdenum ABC transporter ATP-binding protein [Microbulbifer celer]|uniref:Molybdenum ABC transporter ATP-binding protein n=1 Tax=Microbulbifer celer TaxID=435905 RepID=A0ABW3U743_9GAMM|nr:molybdenum ABC transporter ATP-binding protein [Microbulbifer celer]UFN58828.1 molybdenum ABC transporter ATP-binding protein [Microbulbifer celer]
MGYEKATETRNRIHGQFHLPLRRAHAHTSSNAFFLDVNFSVPGSGVTGIFGPSGSGKTTLLRCIAGLQKCPNGRLTINGDTWQDGHRSLPTHRRPLGFVFQQPSLFPHLTARGNLEFARKRATEPVSDQEYQQIIDLMGIGDLLEQSPAALSGGEQQRVAITRALLIKPRLLLMDEPLASLDLPRKREILPYLERLHQSLKVPILYVSHSIDEIARLADHLLLLEDGKLVNEGPTHELLSREDFPVQMGDDLGVLLQASICDRDEHWQLIQAHFDGGKLWLRDTGEALGVPIRLRVLARDLSLTLQEDTASSILNRLPVRIQEITADRDPAMLLVRLKPLPRDSDTDSPDCSTRLIARITRRSCHQLNLKAGSEVWAQIKSVAIVR